MTAKLAVSVTDAAKCLSIGRSQVYVEIAAQRLRSFKVGRRRLISMTELMRWQERRELLTAQEGARR